MIPTIRPRGPASRSSDAETSRESERFVNESGIRDSQAHAVYEALRRHEGSTSSELATLGGFDRYTPARRLPDLERLGLVKKGESRRCRVGGRAAITWWIAQPAARRQGRLF